MANTYTQIYIQLVFAVEGRRSLIPKEHKVEIYKEMTTVLQNKKQKVMAINGMPDHVHLLIGQSLDIALSDLVKDVKIASSRLINDKRWVRGHFKTSTLNTILHTCSPSSMMQINCRPLSIGDRYAVPGGRMARKAVDR